MNSNRKMKLRNLFLLHFLCAATTTKLDEYVRLDKRNIELGKCYQIAYKIFLMNLCRASQPLATACIFTADCSRFFSKARSSRAAFVCSRKESLVDLGNIFGAILEWS